MSTTEAGRLAAFGKPDSTRPDGVSLQAVIEAARRLDELSCARVVGNAADAVHAAQKAGQPLGMLCPAAILVLPDGSVKLVTGGAASPHYTAPEKLRGGASDRRADVFALGVVLWEALAHERLFEGANDGAIKQAVLAGSIRPPSELNANVPAELDAICKKALARDPSDRYQSAKVMAAEIDAVLGDAGYPESNEQIASYVAKALAPEPAKPVPPVLPAMQAGGKAVPLPSAMPSTAGDTLPPPFVPARQAPPTAILGSSNPLDVTTPTDLGSLPLILEPPLRPLPQRFDPKHKPSPRVATSPAKSAKTEILGSLSPVAPTPSLAKTAFLGSGATASPAPASSGSPVAHPQPPTQPSIANAETIATPQLPAHLAVPPVAPQLGMPPGMTLAPATPPAPLQSVEQDFDDFDEHHADPAEVIARHHAETKATGGRDVLAGWGWSTGSVEAIDDDDDVHDLARAGRKRLVLAVGGALGAVIIIAVVAFAFGGSKQPGDQAAQASAAKPSSTAPVTPTTPPPPDPSAPSAPSAAAPSQPENPTPEPPKPEPEPAAVEPPRPEPPKAVAAEPPRPEPPKAAAAEPPKVAAAIKAPTPAKAELPKSEPPRATPPKKLEAKKPEAKKPEAKKPEAKKPEAKKPEAKKPDKVAKHAPPPERVARATPKAQPVDPYATPTEKPKADPAAAYRTGLQQYAHGDTAGALSTLRTSLSSNPTFAPTWRGLGLVYEKLGNKGQARSAFKRYLQLAPDAGDADQIRDRLERLGS